MGKLHHAAQVFGFKPTAKLLRQLIPHAMNQWVTILGAISAAQHFGAQAFAHAPIQARAARRVVQRAVRWVRIHSS